MNLSEGTLAVPATAAPERSGETVNKIDAFLTGLPPPRLLAICLGLVAIIGVVFAVLFVLTLVTIVRIVTS